MTSLLHVLFAAKFSRQCERRRRGALWQAPSGAGEIPGSGQVSDRGLLDIIVEEPSAKGGRFRDFLVALNKTSGSRIIPKPLLACLGLNDIGALVDAGTLNVTSAAPNPRAATAASLSRP